MDPKDEKTGGINLPTRLTSQVEPAEARETLRDRNNWREISAPNRVDQQGAKASGDVIGRDKLAVNTAIINLLPEVKAGPLGSLLNKLKAEVEANQLANGRVADLAHYYKHVAHDDVVGLEAKLTRAGREREIAWALEQKERFSKLLIQWSLYASAQELFAYLLERADFEFARFIMPKLEEIEPGLIDEEIKQRIVMPTVSDCADGIFRINPAVAMGMVYWLAEQCYIRWHR